MPQTLLATYLHSTELFVYNGECGDKAVLVLQNFYLQKNDYQHSNVHYMKKRN